MHRNGNIISLRGNMGGDFFYKYITSEGIPSGSPNSSKSYWLYFLGCNTVPCSMRLRLQGRISLRRFYSSIHRIVWEEPRGCKDGKMTAVSMITNEKFYSRTVRMPKLNGRKIWTLIALTYSCVMCHSCQKLHLRGNVQSIFKGITIAPRHIIKYLKWSLGSETNMVPANKLIL